MTNLEHFRSVLQLRLLQTENIISCTQDSRLRDNLIGQSVLLRDILRDCPIDAFALLPYADNL